MILAAAPLALAQTSDKPKKKGAKPAASAPADSAADTPPPAPAPDPAPAASSTSATDDGGDAAPKGDLPAIPPEPISANSDTLEDPLKSYTFIGLRYRGTVVPQFLINAFVNEGATFYSNMVGAELDIRKDGHSTMPWIAFANYGFGDTLFEQDSNSGGKDVAGNWSVVNSSLNAIYLGLDELWSVPLDHNHHWDFEYGFGVGLGAVFGDLGNNWVYQNASGPLHSSDHGNYSPCQTQSDGSGCSPLDHQNATTAKIGGYKEKAGLLGPKPILFPYVSVPNLGVRFKPVKQFESRLQVGFSLTGFWFGLSVDYGLEKTREPSNNTTARSLRPHDML
jgi:hypothetical protein